MQRRAKAGGGGLASPVSREHPRVLAPSHTRSAALSQARADALHTQQLRSGGPGGREKPS